MLFCNFLDTSKESKKSCCLSSPTSLPHLIWDLKGDKLDTTDELHRPSVEKFYVEYMKTRSEFYLTRILLFSHSSSHSLKWPILETHRDTLICYTFFLVHQ